MSTAKDLLNNLKLTKCGVEGHYYKVDVGREVDSYIPVVGSDPPDSNQEIISRAASLGLTFYVKCARCGYRILINDKSYERRQKGDYTL